MDESILPKWRKMIKGRTNNREKVIRGKNKTEK